MFLDRLNNKEKEMFLDLAVYAAQANGVVEEAEKEAIMGYCKEMGVPFYDISKLHPFQEITDFFSALTKEKKRIVVFEIMGLCATDGETDEVESAFINKFADDIGLPEDVFETLQRDIEEYLIIYQIVRGHVLN